MTTLTRVELNQTLLIGLVVVFISALLFSLFPSWPSDVIDGLPLAREDFDVQVYWQGAQWFKLGLPPYRGTVFNQPLSDTSLTDGTIPYVAETYPQLAMLYFTVPALFTNNFATYQWLFFIWNSFWFLGLMMVIRKLLKLLQLEKFRLYWLFFPSFLFYTFNRYDIFVACLVMWSLLLLLEKRFTGSFILLGLATLAKVYPMLLLPIYLLYLKNHQGRVAKELLTLALIILLPLLLFMAWVGALPTIAPYLIHLTRPAAAGTLLFTLQQIVPWPWFVWLTNWSFKLIQFTLPLWLILALIFNRHDVGRLTDSAKKIISLASLSILLFIIFNPFYSNQWVLWLVPWLILTIPASFGWLVLAYDLVNYFHYPLTAALLTSSLSITTVPNTLSHSLAVLYLVSTWTYILILLYLVRWLMRSWNQNILI